MTHSLRRVSFTSPSFQRDQTIDPIELAIREAQELAIKNRFSNIYVCETKKNGILALSELHLFARDDIIRVIFTTDTGYQLDKTA